MFATFIIALRQAGIPASVTEHLALLPLSTLDKNGVTELPSSGHTVTTEPSRGSYQL